MSMSPTLQQFMRCTQCGEPVSWHTNGVCPLADGTLAPLTRENFDIDIFERVLSEMREAKAPHEVREELFSMCPHPSEYRSESQGVTYCKLCFTLLP